MSAKTDKRAAGSDAGMEAETGENTAAVSVRLPEVSIERPALYVVATPIGNLGDTGLRALAVLGGVDCVFCEDTRHTRGLMDHFGIHTPLVSCHEHNETARAQALIADLADSERAAALVSDAGTPLVSDPGYTLVRTALAAGIPVRSVPGASALLAALSIGGLAAERFCFEGFLPARAGPRDARLQSLRDETRTLVFYEAPHRITKTLAALTGAFGATRAAVVAREITKRFESVYRGTLAEVADALAQDPHGQRGEFVVLVAGASAAADLARVDRYLDIIAAEVDQKTAVRLVAALTGAGRNEVYRRALALKSADRS